MSDYYEVVDRNGELVLIPCSIANIAAYAEVISENENHENDAASVAEPPEPDENIQDIEHAPQNIVENSLVINEVNAIESNNDGNVPIVDPNIDLLSATTPKCGCPKKGRKRRRPQTRTERKKSRNSNQPYYKEDEDQLTYEREFRDYHCTCKNPCHEAVDVEIRRQIFNNFWGLEDYNAQTMFIAALISQTVVKRKRNPLSTKRSYSRVYSLNGVPVCRSIFIHTLRISTSRVTTALAKTNGSPKSLQDQRGKSTGGQLKLPESTVTKVIAHIKSFPTYISHYCRKETEVKFLPEDLTIPKMFSLFQEKYPTVKCSQTAYQKIFYENFNLRRKVFKKDTFNTCDMYVVRKKNAATEIEREELEKRHNDHVLAADQARAAMKENLKTAFIDKDDETETLTFDLEKALPLPRIPTNIVYYKRQLIFYNLGIYSGKEKKGFCYTWTEAEAGRGAQEVGSCLKKHLMTHCMNIKHLILWSDSCGGQNRNIKLMLIMKSCFDDLPNLQTITCKYLLSGHSMLPNDSDFGDIECTFKYNPRIYTDADYRRIIESCRTKNPLQVYGMVPNDFIGTASLEKLITNRKVSEEKKKINWLLTRQITLHRTSPFKLAMRQCFDGYDDIVNLQKRSAGRPASDQFSSNLIKLWPNGKPISAPKRKDLLSLMYLIPHDAKPFYADALKSDVTADIVDDVEGFNCAALDFDIEDFVIEEDVDGDLEELNE